MTYSNEEKRKINAWIAKCGAPYSNCDDFYEYKHGQLLEATERLGSLIDWDEWQHLQACLGTEIPLELALRISSALWENDIEVLELKTEASKTYDEQYKDWWMGRTRYYE